MNYKVKKSVQKSSDEWVRIPDAHEPIIEKFRFDMVQKLLASDCRCGTGGEVPHMYAGLLYCGDCNEPMTRRVGTYKGKTTVRFICSNYNKNGECSRHSILQEDLDRLVLYGIKSRIELIHDQMTTIAAVKNLDMRYDDIVAFDKEIVTLKEEQEKYKKLRAALYADYKRGIISEDDYKSFSAVYEEKFHEIQKDLDRQMENLKNLFKNGLDAGMRLEQYKGILQLEKLNRTALVQLVEKIFVHEDNTVHVVFRYQNHFLKIGMLYNFLKAEERQVG